MKIASIYWHKTQVKLFTVINMPKCSQYSFWAFVYLEKHLVSNVSICVNYSTLIVRVSNMCKQSSEAVRKYVHLLHFILLDTYKCSQLAKNCGGGGSVDVLHIEICLWKSVAI